MRKLEIPRELEWRLLIRKPSGRRTSYRVIKRMCPPLRGEVTVQDKRIDVINQMLHEGKLASDKVLSQIELVVEAMYREAGVKFFKVVSGTANVEILNRFWDEEYAHRSIKDPVAMYHDYRRAVECLGELPLASATQRDIEAAIRSRCGKNAAKQRRVTARLSTLLKYCNRDAIKLRMDRPPRPEPQYLTEAEVSRLLPHLPDRKTQVLVKMAFATGCRIGELFALEAHHYKPGGEIEVAKQIYADGTPGDTKNGSRRRTLFLEDRALYDEWVELKHQFPKRIRNSISKTFRSACAKAFDNPNKNMPFKDLRHSYAVHLSQAGVSVSLISNCLGNTEYVCETYYKSHEISSEDVGMVRLKLENKKKLAS